MNDLNRRHFLGLAGGAAASGVLAACNGSSSVQVSPENGDQSLPPAEPTAAPIPSEPAPTSTFGEVENRTLVVVEMAGGNDALNTLVPQSGSYRDLRPTIALTDDELLTWESLEYGVNPALAGLTPLWESGQLAGLYGVGMPQQSRSHFVALDTWWSAQPGVPATSGWLGRWLEHERSLDLPPLRAISLGGSTPAASSASGQPVAVQSVDGYRLSPPDGNTAVTDAVQAMASPVIPGLYGRVQTAIPNTVQSVDQLQSIIASTAADNDDTYGPEASSTFFAAAQAIIQADVGTQVIYLKVGGFDSHAGQREQQDPLLQTVADGLGTMFAALERTGHHRTTLAMTFSEFGRRAAENGSNGTDHGKGGLAFLAGPVVAGSQVVGEVDLARLDDGDLPVTMDSRSVYTNALNWLGGVNDALGDETFDTYGLLHSNL